MAQVPDCGSLFSIPFVRLLLSVTLPMPAVAGLDTRNLYRAAAAAGKIPGAQFHRPRQLPIQALLQLHSTTSSRLVPTNKRFTRSGFQSLSRYSVAVLTVGLRCAHPAGPGLTRRRFARLAPHAKAVGLQSLFVSSIAAGQCYFHLDPNSSGTGAGLLLRPGAPTAGRMHIASNQDKPYLTHAAAP